MKFKKAAYYSIIALLVVSIAVGFVFLSTEVIRDAESDFKPSDTIVSPDNSIKVNEDNQDDTGTTIVPTFKNAFKLWDYTYDIFRNGKGYSATSNSTATSLIGEQYVYSKLFRNGSVDDMKNNLEYIWKKGTSSKFENSATVCYTNAEGACYFVQTPDQVWKESVNLTSLPEAKTYADICTLRGRDDQDLIIPISAKDAKLVYFDKTNKGYYEFRVIIKEDSIPEEYYQPVIESPYIDDIINISISVTVRVSKKTGYLISYTTDEKFEAVPAGILGIVGNQECSNKTTISFTSMNKVQEIENPFAHLTGGAQ